MTFGEKLKLLRYEKGLTQDDMGYLLNVTKSCISCYENGSRQPSLDILVQVATYFRVSIDFLIGMDSCDSQKKINFTKKDKQFLDLLKNNPTIYKKIMDNPKNSVLKLKELFQKQEA